MADKNKTKAYLKLFIKRNEIFNNFNVDHSQQSSLSDVNLKYISINNILNKALNTMTPEDRMDLYISLTLIGAQVDRILENSTQPFSPKISFEKLKSYDEIIQAVAGFEYFVKTSYPKEFTEDKINEALENKCKEQVIETQNLENASLQLVEATDAEKIIDNITNESAPNDTPEEVDVKEDVNIYDDNKFILTNQNNQAITPEE